MVEVHSVSLSRTTECRCGHPSKAHGLFSPGRHVCTECDCGRFTPTLMCVCGHSAADHMSNTEVREVVGGGFVQIITVDKCVALSGHESPKFCRCEKFVHRGW